MHGDRYGTPLTPLLTQMARGHDLLLDIDVHGAAQLKARLAGRYVFVLPPSATALQKRLTNRGTEIPEVIARRLAAAITELQEARLFDTWVINDDLETAYTELKAAYLAETLRPAYRPVFLSKLIKHWNV